MREFLASCSAPMAWYIRILAFAGAIGLLIPGTMTDLVGLALLVLIVVVQVFKAKRMKAAGLPLTVADIKKAKASAK